MITTSRQRKLILAAFHSAAKRNLGTIKPVGKAKSFCDPRCFSNGYGKISGGKLIFWYDTLDGSTHVIMEDIEDANKSNLPN